MKHFSLRDRHLRSRCADTVDYDMRWHFSRVADIDAADITLRCFTLRLRVVHFFIDKAHFHATLRTFSETLRRVRTFLHWVISAIISLLLTFISPGFHYWLLSSTFLLSWRAHFVIERSHYRLRISRTFHFLSFRRDSCHLLCYYSLYHHTSPRPSPGVGFTGLVTLRHYDIIIITAIAVKTAITTLLRHYCEHITARKQMSQPAVTLHYYFHYYYDKTCIDCSILFRWGEDEHWAEPTLTFSRW